MIEREGGVLCILIGSCRAEDVQESPGKGERFGQRISARSFRTQQLRTDSYGLGMVANQNDMKRYDTRLDAIPDLPLFALGGI